MHNYLEIIAYWQQQNIDSIPKLEQALNNFNILFAYNSGVIENPSITYHDTREIFENGKVNILLTSLLVIFSLKVLVTKLYFPSGLTSLLISIVSNKSKILYSFLL